MSRLSDLKSKLNKERVELRRRASNKRSVDTMILRAENKKLEEELREIKKANDAATKKTELKRKIRDAKKARIAAKLAPLKTAFDRAKKIVGNSPLSRTATSTSNNNPLMGGSNDFIKRFNNTTKPKTAFNVKPRKRRVKIIEYE